jgi:hypothetical protein
MLSSAPLLLDDSDLKYIEEHGVPETLREDLTQLNGQTGRLSFTLKGFEFYIQALTSHDLPPEELLEVNSSAKLHALGMRIQQARLDRIRMSLELSRARGELSDATETTLAALQSGSLSDFEQSVRRREALASKECEGTVTRVAFRHAS